MLNERTLNDERKQGMISDVKSNPNAYKIIWYEIAAFGAIILISWLNEIGGLSKALFGGNYELNWKEAVLETAITIVVAIPAIILSWKLSKRLHYLEDFIRVCAWCKKVGYDDKWISFEEFLHKKFNTETSHGICPDCYEKYKGTKIKQEVPKR
jgi:hypothetical protein